MRRTITLLLTLISASVFSDDGWVGGGGNPRLMGSHKSVTMVSEKVTMDIGPKVTRVRCVFVFRNDGPACKVRMGFPDYGAREEDYAEFEKNGKPPGALTGFRSWVDGKRVRITHVPGGPKRVTVDSWWVKDVEFARGQTRTAIDKYKVGTGVGAAAGDLYVRYGWYVMRTGASWHGPIGDATVIVNFSPKVMHKSIKAVSVASLGLSKGDDYKHWNKAGKRFLCYSGFAKASVKGRTLTFHATNLKPTKRSDIWLYFSPIKPSW